MKKTLLLSFVLASILFGASGCSSSSEPGSASAADKKAFAGAPPPKDYMDTVRAGEDAARKGAAKAAADHSK